MILRIYQEDLKALDQSRECEVCHGHMAGHEWADLDEDGFVVDCVNSGYIFET